MDFNIEQLKKKIIYRSNYRGTKEMDKLLGAFTKEYIDKLSDDDLLILENLLNVDDENLYNFYKGLKTEIKFEKNKINLLFKNFKLSNKC
jgi:antitoxin CptB